MIDDGRHAATPGGVQRYRVFGGGGALYVVAVFFLVAAGAAALGAFELAIGAAGVGWAASALSRSLVVELSPTGLTRGLVAAGAFRGRTTVIPWAAVVDLHTTWCRAGDDSALETTVAGRDGRRIRLSTVMGLAGYWACLAEIARRAPAAARSGLTDAVLADGPPARHHVVSAAGTAAALAVLIAALVAMHYVWAQGRSSLGRYLEQTGAADRPAVRACAPGPERGADRRSWLVDSCR
jgi:hypothetical protein